MKSICEAVKSGKILVSDGAWGTLLQQKGMEPGECPELWCVERPDDVKDIAQQYIDAGADIVMTDSFGGTCYKLEHYGLSDRAAELNEEAARLSREAAGEDRYVMASMGPTGKILMMGEVTEEELYEAFKVQAIAFEKGGADAVIVETITAVDEAVLGVRAVKENTGLEAICSFTYDMHTADGYRTMMGVSPAAMAAQLLAAGADALGANCSLGSDEMVEVVAELRAAAPETPILVHPNAGRPNQLDDGTIEYPETPEIMSANVAALVAAGANIIGGCCGSTPEHIKQIRAAVDAL